MGAVFFSIGGQGHVTCLPYIQLPQQVTFLLILGCIDIHVLACPLLPDPMQLSLPHMSLYRAGG